MHLLLQMMQNSVARSICFIGDVAAEFDSIQTFSIHKTSNHLHQVDCDRRGAS